MSDLINTDPMPEETPSKEISTASPWTALFTMLLLSIGFLVTSALLIRQAFNTKNSEGEPIITVSSLIEDVKTRSATTPIAMSQNCEETSDLKEIPPDEPATPATGKVKWPHLKLIGFGKSADGTESFAIINNQQVHPGEYVGKVMLSEVRANDVIVEYKGEYKILTNSN